MDYEKKYKEALERARELKNKLEKSCSLATPTGIETIFPELKMNEDERIRKELICGIQDACVNGGFSIYTKRATINEWIAWLEKQGKRNNIVEQLTAFAQHLAKRGAFRDDLCMDFEHEAQSFIEMQNKKEL